VLVGALLLLLLAEGDFLAEWVLMLETAFIPRADVGEGEAPAFEASDNSLEQ